MNADIAVRFLCWDNYLTAGTDEVSKGMVKRVVDRAHRGAGHEFSSPGKQNSASICADSRGGVNMTFKTQCVWSNS